MKLVLSIVSAALMLSAISTQAQQGRPRQSSSELRDLEAQLRAAVQDAAQEASSSDAFKKALVADEVLPRFRRFVTEFKRSGNKVNVEVDRSALNRFLEFRPLAAGARIAVRVSAAPECKRCEQAVAEVSKNVTSRLNKRGFKSQVNEKLVTFDGSSAEARLALAMTTALKEGFSGIVIAQLSNIPPDPDSAHPDEEQFLARVGLAVARDGVTEFSNVVELETLASDPLSVSADRLLTDLMIEAGARGVDSKLGQSAENKSAGKKQLVRISGIGGYTQMLRLKEALTEVSKESGFTFREKELSRGTIVYEFTSSLSREQLELKLSATRDSFSSTKWSWE